MKKLLLLITISFSITIHSHASDTTAVQKATNQVSQSITDAKNGISDAIKSVVPDSASLSFSKVYDDVKTGVSGLAAALKIGADHVYYVLVKQQMVYAFTYIGVILILMIASIIGYREARAAFNAHRQLGKEMIGDNNMTNWDLDDSGKGILAVAVSVLTGICLVVLVVTISTNLETIMMGLINPEYGAIKDIISFVK